jgi:hypothetical protein
MPESLDPTALLLRLIGGFYAFAGLVAGRVALSSALMDAALAGLSGKAPSQREWALSFWLTTSTWLVFAGGALLIILSREAMWVFIVCALTQAFYLTVAAPYYFDVEDPPDPVGRRRTTNAFFIYLGATMFVIWASGRHLTPLTGLHPLLSLSALAAIATFAGYLVWQTISTARMPKLGVPVTEDDGDGNGEPYGDSEDWARSAKYFDLSLLRIELTRDDPASPLKNQKTGAPIALETLELSASLRDDLQAWMRDGDPEMTDRESHLAERLALECPDAAVAVPGILHAYVGYDVSSPYADPETGKPNWDRMTAVKIMADYDCWPCWAANDGVAGPIAPNFLGLSGALEDALLEWQHRFDVSIDRDNPADPVWTGQEAQAHTADGLELARRVKQERPDLTVYVQSPRGVLVVDLNSPPEFWHEKPEIKA